MVTRSLVISGAFPFQVDRSQAVLYNGGMQAYLNEREQALAQGIGIRILTLRKKKGLTLQQLGRALGVSKQLVGQWENGMGLPKLYRLDQMRTLFEVPLDDLIRAVDEDYIRPMPQRGRRGPRPVEEDDLRGMILPD